MANKIDKIKFLISLIQPDARKQLRVLQTTLTAFNIADRRLFDDADSFVAVLAGQLHEAAGRPAPMRMINFEMAAGRAIVAALPHAVERPAEIAIHGKNRQLLESAFIGCDVNAAKFTTGDLAEFARVSDAYVRAEIAQGRLTAEKVSDAVNAPHLIAAPEARRWLLADKRGSRTPKASAVGAE